MAKDSADKVSQKNLEYNNARAEKTKRGKLTDDSKKQLKKNLKR